MKKAPIIIGNWKMYKTTEEALHFLKEITPTLKKTYAVIGLAVPFTSLEACSKAAKKMELLIGAQNINDAREGAFTGEIAAKMVKAAGANFVLLGHSERRKYFHESNEIIHAKVKRALQEELDVVLCIGETLEEREHNHEEVLKQQITEGLKDISPDRLDQIMIAYEPVWAIGTGVSATPKIAQETHAFCRKCLASLFEEKGKGIPILYGGSVKPDTVSALLEQPDIDGALVGGASLDVKSFSAIIEPAKG